MAVTLSNNIRALSRQERIVQHLLLHASASVTELAEALHVSSWTIRRDLSALEGRGLLERRYGKALVAESGRYESFTSSHPADEERTLRSKTAIGRAAARLVQPGQHVALSAGSTMLEVARALRSRNVPCRVVTNALNIAIELSQASAVRVTCSGGEVDGDYYTLNGPTAERVLSGYYFDLAIIGVSGVTLREGLTVNSQMNAVALSTMLDHSKRVVVVADARKFGEVRFAHLGALEHIDVLVTDTAPPPDLADYFEASGIEVVVADRPA
ncbi:DeoR/GlpR family DNA-binding transcription regulator [Deinococcus sp.]|uniref:DeoR/GlpR family DNA-binding transcription regulator n=1 Tax=Deinococcus sp. TaxID=47478 RepID=UPI003CC5351D